MTDFKSLMPPIVGLGNDWTAFERLVEKYFNEETKLDYALPVSVVIPVYNRKDKLAKTIAGLTHSTYPLNLIEVIIADDGSSDNPEEIIPQFEKFFDMKYVSQEDLGYRLSEVRNLGVKTASHEQIIILDCDMLPEPTLVESYMKYMHISDKVILIGGRRYVNTDHLTTQDILDDIEVVLNLPIQRVDSGRGPIGDEEPSIDWRYKWYEQTNNAKNAKYAFRWLCGGNICFNRQLHNFVGGFDETFTAWGSEDQEYGYRLYLAGAWFIPVENAEGLHQEPPGGSNETDREEGREITQVQLVEKCPVVTYRKYEENRMYEIPKVSIYIPAYNCIDYIEEAVESALNQTYTDIEIVICNDGSTDGTEKLLEELYGENPKVVVINKENGGISSASNTAIAAARGEYILQLDSDDVLLPIAVESLVRVFDTNKEDIGFVYGDSYLIDEDGLDLGRAYSWSIFDRFKILDGMMIHHPRMFRRRDFNRSGGFDENISNAVDYDFFLKMSETTTGYHLQTPLYLYRQHTKNTSNVNRGDQDNNSHYSIKSAIKRLGLQHRVELSPHPTSPRKLTKKVIDKPTEYKLDCTEMFKRLGIKENLDPYIHRWELDQFVSKENLERMPELFTSPERFIRVGPFGSAKVAEAVAARIVREQEVHAEMYPDSVPHGFAYFVEVQTSNKDKEALDLRRILQEQQGWRSEVVSRRNPGAIIAGNSAVSQIYKTYLKKSSATDVRDKSRYDPNIHWKTKGELLIFEWQGMEIFFEMPLDWKFENTHPDLFQLAHHIMVEPWDRSAMIDWNPTRKPGWRPGLAFSGGIDSAAAMALMPQNTILIYNERKGIPGILNHTNAIRFFDELEQKTGRRVVRVGSNHEIIRTHVGKMAGFSTDYACAIQVILLADYFGLDSIGTGMPLENSYLFHGYRFRDFGSSWFWKHYAPMFDDVGLSLYQPVAGCSEIINMKIVQDLGWDGWAQSCLRSTEGGKVCGQCWKCFRKNTLLNIGFELSNEINTFLKKEPLKQAASTIYSIKRGGITDSGVDIREEFPHLNEFLDINFSWLEHHYPDAMSLLPEKYEKYTRKKLAKFVRPMNSEEKVGLRNIDLYPKENKN